MKKHVKCMIPIFLILSLVLIFEIPRPAKAKDLKGTPYIYTNEGEWNSPDNKLRVRLSGDYIKIKAKIMWKGSEYTLHFLKKFKTSSKIRKYECGLEREYKGAVDRQKFVQDLKSVHDHKWGVCIFYVEKGRIIAYELHR